MQSSPLISGEVLQKKKLRNCFTKILTKANRVVDEDNYTGAVVFINFSFPKGLFSSEASGCENRQFLAKRRRKGEREDHIF